MNVLTLLLAVSSAPHLGLDNVDGVRGSLVAVGDVNRDGVIDFAFAHRSRPFGMSAIPTEEWPSVEQEPVIWVLSGKDGQVLRSFRGGKEFGSTLEAAGDLDGDGVIDLAVRELDGVRDHYFKIVLLSVFKGSELATFTNPPHVHEFGRSLAAGKQLVGDSTPDLVIGARGLAWVIDGATKDVAEVIVPDGHGKISRQATKDWAVPKHTRRKEFGERISLLSDLDGDGLGELGFTGREEEDCSDVIFVRHNCFTCSCRTQLYLSRSPEKPLHLATSGWKFVSWPDSAHPHPRGTRMLSTSCWMRSEGGGKK
ncbi:MAG: hypothetical protein ACI8X5_001458 [Planctomycetota bacterium]|jgi:hypothetical protein